jgi:hypothetical protein
MDRGIRGFLGFVAMVLRFLAVYRSLGLIDRLWVPTAKNP